MKMLKWVGALVAALLIAGCGGGGGDSGTPPFGGGGTGGTGGGTATGTALFTTAPGNLFVTLGSSTSQFTINGGTPGYSVTTNNAAVATVTTSGSTFTVNAVGGGDAVISIKDSVGAAVTVGIAVSANSASLFTTAPASFTVGVGTPSQEYLISGGKPGYSVTSSDTAVAQVGINGSRFIVTGVSGGKANLTIKDAVGASVGLEVTVGSATQLFTTAASQISVAVGATQTYAISGGATPYSASSSNGVLAAASVSGSTLSITGAFAGTVNVVVRDANGASVPIAVIVGSNTAGTALFTSAASDIVVAAGTTPTFTVGGGTGPYTVSSSNVAVARGAVSATTTLGITGVATGSAKIVVLDTLGAKAEINVVVGAGPAVSLYTTAPISATIASGTAQPYIVGGGFAPYVVTSSNAAVSTASISGSALTIGGVAGGSAQISVFDSTGKSVTFSVTVPGSTALYTTAPSSVTAAIGSSLVYAVGGGKSPYTATSSNAAVAAATLTGNTLSIGGVKAGTGRVEIRDANGDLVSIAVDVTDGIALYTSSPTSVSAAIGSTLPFVVGGGTAPYIATSSSPGVASVTLTGTAFAITGVSTGTAQVVLTDAVGARATISVTSASGSGLFTTAPNFISTGYVAVPYTVGGGTAPYTATSSNIGVSTVSLSGTAMTITGVSAGSAQIVVRDAAGATVTVFHTVTAPAGSAFFTTAPLLVSIPIGSVSYTVGGGTAPYVATSSNTSVATVLQTGNTLTVTGAAPGSADVEVRDAAGAIKTVSVTVASGTPLYTTVPTLGVEALTGSTLTYTVGGGTGPYTATSGNPAVASVTLSGTSLAISGLTVGTAILQVRDAVGATQSVFVTVRAAAGSALYTTAPTFVSIPFGVISYTVGGGTGPYTATSDNTSVATVSLNSGVLTVTGLAVGRATVVIRDASGTTLSVFVDVASGTALYTTAPGFVEAVAGSGPLTYTIAGGTGPYTVTSSNTGVVTASGTGTSTLTLTGISSGSGTVEVRDAAGARVSIVVLVTLPAGSALYTTAPSFVSIPLSSVSYTIGGGTAPYTVTSSNTSVAAVGVSTAAGVTTLSVTGLSPGLATVVVQDAAGTRVSFVVDVASGTPLFTTAPTFLSVPIGGVALAPFAVGGGTIPYTATSSNVSVATVSVSGTALTITGVAPGSADLIVRDAAGGRVTIVVNVAAGTALKTTAPNAVIVAPTSAPAYLISGGVAPYSASTSSAQVATAAVSGGTTLTITGNALGTASVTVRDSAGSSVSIAVTVNSVAPLYTAAPSSVTIAKDVSAPYAIGGGTANYTATSSDARVATATVTGTGASSVLTITGAATGTASVLVRDAAGNTTTINVTVGTSISLFSSAPSSITILPAATQTYAIGGGQSPYTVESSNRAFVTTAVAGSSFDITGIAAGATSVVIRDAAGATVTVAVTVTPTASIPLSVGPLAVTASVGDTLTFTISGGNSAYIATVTNPSVASIASTSGVDITDPLKVVVTGSGTTFSVRLLNAGATSVLITDAKGQTETVTLTVTPVQPLLRLSPSLVAVSELSTAGIAMDVFGGTAPYSAYTSDQALSSVTVIGSRVTVGLGTNLNRCISPATLGYVVTLNSFSIGDTTFGSSTGTVATIITVVDATGRATTSSLFIVDSVGACP